MNRIEVNEIVQVTRGAPPDEIFVRRALVLHVPAATGDLWGFKDLDTAREVWTSEPLTILRRDPGPMNLSGLWPKNRALVVLHA